MSVLSAGAPPPAEWLDRVFAKDSAVLLCTSGANQSDKQWLLFTDPIRYITAIRPCDVNAAFDQLEQARDAGYYLAGYLTYEAGAALQGLPAHTLPKGEPLLCFGVFREPERHSATEPNPAFATGATDAAELNLALFPAVSRQSYARQLAAIQRWIVAGDIYQANYTFPLVSLTPDPPQIVFHSLLRQQLAAYAAALRLVPPDSAVPALLSFSPELFFRTSADGSIFMQPMKGTVARSSNNTEDDRRAQWLAADPKNRAEHVMIVDLLRNDLGRICQTGSVQTSNLFDVRQLPTVHQMVSDVSGQLRPGVTLLEIFRALFPSGSVTGAPKLRAMQVLHATENSPRGSYTGAIGYVAPSGESGFSVAIRTLTLRPWSNQHEVTCGVGGGIVADSHVADEYQEALLKAAFVNCASKPVQVIETMRSEGGKLPWLKSHMDRLQRTAESIGVPFVRANTMERVQAAARLSTQSSTQRVRVTLSAAGEIDIRMEPLAPWPDRLRVRLALARTHLGDPALTHKTTFRESYDEETNAARQAGFDESLFANDAGLVTEGSVTSLYFVRGGKVFTPYIACGALPGVLRTQLLEHGLVEESLLPLADVDRCDALMLGNSLRGMFAVHSLQVTQADTITWDCAAAEPYLIRLQHFVSAAFA